MNAIVVSHVGNFIDVEVRVTTRDILWLLLELEPGAEACVTRSRLARTPGGEATDVDVTLRIERSEAA